MNTKNIKPIKENALIKPEDGKNVAPGAEQGPHLHTSVKELLASTGGRSTEVGLMLLDQVRSLQKDGGATDETLRLGLKLLGEMTPRNATEGMLAVQMIGVHNAALEFLKRSLLMGQTVGGIDGNVNRACRLMGLFTEQLTAMAKLRGTASQQKMTVEHVHIHAGGQAIVGPVAGAKSTPGNEGGQSENHRNNP